MRNLLSFHKKPKWQPGANTVLYYPFKDDYTDKVGSTSIYYNASSGGSITKSTIGYQFSISGNHAYGLQNIPSNYIFVSYWAKATSSSGIIEYSKIAYDYYYVYLHSNSTYSKKFVCNGAVVGSSSTSDNVWYHFAYGYDNGKAVAYINGNLVNNTSASWSGTETSRWFLVVNTAATIIFSEFIGESKCRTAQEVQDYYNQTKGDYGL